jgi:hypothetical protein
MSTLRLAAHIARCLDEDKLDYAVGGALALTVHALPRDTADVDISVFAAVEELPRVFDALERAGVMVDRADATRSQARIGMFTGRAGKRLVDVFLYGHPHFEAMHRRRVQATTPSGELLWFISAEDLCVTKLVFARAKDIADLEHVFAANPKLDVEYIRSWLVQMPPPIERRLAILDDLAARFASR